MGMAWYMVWHGGHGMKKEWPVGHGIVYGMAWRCIASHGVWRPRMLYSIAWRASHGIMVWPGGPGMWYGMAWQASHSIVWPGGHHMVYDMAWRASHSTCIWLWPGRQGMGLCIVCSMTWRAWHGIWYGLAVKGLCMVWPGAHGMVYGMAWRSWHDICYGLAGITWYIVWSGGHRMVYGMACSG